MKKNFKNLNLQDLLSDASPEQMIIWNDIFLRFGDNIAIQQYVTRGTAPTEMTAYQLGRVFFGYDVIFGANTGIFGAQPIVTLNDEANNNSMILTNTTSFFNVANQWSANHIQVKNILFSKFTQSNYQYVFFSGFRIIYQ